VYGACCGANHMPSLGLGPAQERRFRHLWRMVAEARNPFVHQYVATQDDAWAMRELLSELASLGVPELLSELRLSLAPKTEPRSSHAAPVASYRVRLEGPGLTALDVPPGSRIQWELYEASAPVVRCMVTLEVGEATIRLEEIECPMPDHMPAWAERLALAVLSLRQEDCVRAWPRSAIDAAVESRAVPGEYLATVGALSNVLAAQIHGNRR